MQYVQVSAGDVLESKSREQVEAVTSLTKTVTLGGESGLNNT